MAKVAAQTKVTRAALLAQVGQFLGRAISTRNVMFNQTVADQLGINTTDLRCLDLLDREGDTPITIGRLSELSGLSAATTTDLIDRLERAGFVVRERSAQDRRQVLIRQTEKAKTSVSPMFDGIERAMANLAESYSTKDLALIHDFLSRSIAIAREEAAHLRELGPQQQK